MTTMSSVQEDDPNRKYLPTLVIIRGLPGSGKSKMARLLSERTGAMVIEPDAVCVMGGKYHYDKGFHKKAQELVCIPILRKLREACADAIYADVLPTLAEVEIIAETYGPLYFRVIDTPLLTVDESMARNCHNVRREDIERMAREWQPWEDGTTNASY